MIIPRLAKSSSSYYFKTHKMIKIPRIKKLIKVENKKENTIQNENKKKIFLKKIKIVYRPIHPLNQFNSSKMGINEILKKDNLPLITNDNIRNLVLRFNEDREKEILGKRIFYKDKSFEELQKEKNTHFLMIRAMLRKDPLTIQALMKRNREEEKRIKKNASMKSLLRNSSSKKYFSKTTIMSEENISIEKSVNDINNGNLKLILKKKNKPSKKQNSKKNNLSKEESLKKYLKKHEIKIRNVSSLILGGRLSFIKTLSSIDVKFNQDCIYTNINLKSSKLGEVSLFALFDGNGQYGKNIALAFKNYVVDYFQKGTNMKVTLNKDNFYSIMYNAFDYAQDYLINNANKLNINMKYSGATGIIVLYPHNNSHKIYCANNGRNRCMFYSLMGNFRLSYELHPNRASEKDRISLFKKKREEELEKENKDNKKEKLKIKEQEQEEINTDNDKEKDKDKDDNTNNKMSSNINNEEEKNNSKIKNQIEQKRKEAFLKEFQELDISRCIGNLAAEELGIIPGPEIGESDVKMNKGKFIVIGTDSFWKYLTEDEVGNIVNAHYFINDCGGATKELQELAKDRWKEKNDGGYDDISIVVIFFDQKSL